MQAGAVNIKLMADIADLQAKMREVEKLMGSSAQSFANTQRAAEQMGLSAGVVSKQMDQVGISARQTANAMRMIPMQMTDVVTSLSSGMSPMQVLIQQGGQIKDSFGSMGAALRGVGQYLVGLVNPLTMGAAAVAALGAAYFQGSKEADEFRKQILMTGNAAGTSVDQLAGMAAQMDRSFGVTTAQAAEALAAMAGTGQVGSASLKQYAQLAIDMEKSFGQSIGKTAQHFAELGKDPVEASKRLNESMNYLTAATYQQIRAAKELGQDERAAALAQDAYAQAMKARAGTMTENLGYIEGAWRKVTSFAREAWDAMLGVGRADSVQERLDKLRKQLEDRQESLRQYGNRGGLFGDDTATQVAKLKEQIAFLQETERMQKRAGDAAAERAAKEKAGIEEVDRKFKEQEEAKRKAQAAAEAAARAQEQLVSSGVKLYGDLIAKESGLAADFSEKWDQLGAAYAAGRLSLDELTRAQAALLAQQPLMVKAREDEARLLKQIADAQARTVDQAWKQVDAVQGQINSQRAANLTFGQGKSALAELTLAELEQQMAALEASGDVIPGYTAALQVRIDKQRELIALMKDGEVLEANDKAAKAAAAEWKRTAESIERALTDALMRGFEAGKGFGRNLKDALVNMFKTMVLRPIIQATVTGTLGLGGSQAMAGQGGGLLGNSASLLGIGDTISKVYSTITGGFTALGDSVAFAAQDIGAWLTTNTTGVLNQAGSTLMQSSGALGTAASYAGGMLAGYSIGKAISGQYTTGLGKNTLEVAGTAIGAIFGGPIGAAIGGAIGGLVNRAFGMGAKSVTGEGISGTFAADSGASVQSYSTWFQKGGWFRSNKSGTNYASVSTELDDFLDAAIMMTARATREYAQVVGLSADAISGFSKAINISLKDLDQAGREKAIAAAISGFGDDLAKLVLGEAGKALQRQGETAAAALVRLATALGSVNDVLKSLGQNMLGSSLVGAGNAQALLDLFGGIDAYAQAAGQYLQGFYSEAERLALAQTRVRDALSQIGVVMPASLEAYRRLVEAQDLNTESGQRQYTALLQLAPAFQEVTQAAEAAAQAAKQEAQAQIEALRASGKSISEWLATLRIGASAPAASMGTARQEYLIALNLARANDQSALGSITGLADQYIAAAKVQATSRSQFNAIVAQVGAEVAGLPAVKGYQQESLAILGLINESIGLVGADQLAALGLVNTGVETVGGYTGDTTLNTGEALKVAAKQIEALVFMNNDGLLAVSKNTASSLDYLAAMRDYLKNIDGSTAKTAANPVVVNQSGGGGGVIGKVLSFFGFATGGVFDGQGIYNQPTPFTFGNGQLGVMAEAGPEAVMPLERMSDGALGVRALPSFVYSQATANDGSAEMAALVAEVKALRVQVQELQSNTRATAVSSDKQARILDRVTQGNDSIMTQQVTP